jgi:hypothetical protein
MLYETIIVWRLFPEPVARFELVPPVTLGRLPTCTLRLVDDDVSRLHASVETRDGQLVVADQGSRNGIYVRGRRVGVEAVGLGAILRLGQTLLWFGPRATFRDQIEPRVDEEATRTTPLVLSGETGAGRRTIAEQIHRRSGRSGPFLVATPDEALLRMASGGTVVCDADARFEEAARAAAIHDVRLFGITESTRTPSASTPTLVVPPLRDRLDELPDALRVLLRSDAKAPNGGARATWNADFLEALACHAFPLNFSELHVLCRGLVVAGTPRDEPLGIEQLPSSVRAQVVEARTALSQDLSRERLRDVLTRHRGNVRRIAQELGIQRGQLYRVLARFGLNPDLFRGLASPVDTAANEAAGDERRTLT